MDPFALYRSFLPTTSPSAAATAAATTATLPYALAPNVYGNLLQQLQVVIFLFKNLFNDFIIVLVSDACKSTTTRFDIFCWIKY